MNNIYAVLRSYLLFSSAEIIRKQELGFLKQESWFRLTETVEGCGILVMSILVKSL